MTAFVSRDKVALVLSGDAGPSIVPDWGKHRRWPADSAGERIADAGAGAGRVNFRPAALMTRPEPPCSRTLERRCAGGDAG
jgi:hypothetical protein